MRPNLSNPTAERLAPPPGAGAFALVLALTAAGNVLAHVVPRPVYVPVNLAVAGAAVLLALGPGRCTPADLGLARKDLGSGLRWGGAVAALVAAALVVGGLLPSTRPWFADRRVNAGATWLVLYTTVVRIPLGTVVLEETLFRGVLLGMALRRWSPWRAAAFASALFGLWHVLPASGLAANPATAGLASSDRLATVAFAVVSTALVGAAWCWLRLRARSLLAPALVHVASNSLGYLAAWLVLRGH